MDMYYRPYMESKPFPNSAHPSCSKVQWYETKKIRPVESEKNGGVRSRIVTQSHFPDIQTFVLMVALEP